MNGGPQTTPAPDAAREHGDAEALRRNDFRTVLDLVEPGSRILDLGCGNGALLQLLRDRKQATGYGVEMDQPLIMQCIARGLSVFQGNLDEGLRDFEDQSFDYVILNQTLPAVHRPGYVLDEMLRVGKRGIVSFPNFAYWRIRWHLLSRGRMPVDEIIPYEWYDTPNIHHLTVSDFAAFCGRFGIRVQQAFYFRALAQGRVSPRMLLPNLRAGYALFVISKTDVPTAAEPPAARITS